MRKLILFKKFLCLVLVFLIISFQALTASAADQILKLNTNFNSYSADLFDTGLVSYSISSDEIQYGQSANEIVLAVDTTQSMKYDFDENYDYTSFMDYAIVSLSEEASTEGLFMEGSIGTIYGNIHSNNNLKAQYGQLWLYDESSSGSNLINGKAEASGSTITWPYYNPWYPTTNPIISVTNAPKLKFLDISNSVKSDPSTVIYNSSQTFTGGSAVFNNSIYVNGDLDIQTDSVIAHGLLAAKGNIRIGTTQASLNGPLCIYSETGNVTLANMVGNFKGIIIAPKGTVRIEATEPTVNGRIVGNKVSLASYKMTVDSRGTNSYMEPLLKYIEKETRLYREKEIVKNFISSYAGNAKTKIGVVSYDQKATVVSGLTSMTDTAAVSQMKYRIDALQPSSEVVSNPDGSYKSARRNIGDAMRRAYYMLKNSPDTSASKYIIVLTDEISNVWSFNSLTDSSYKTSDGDSYYTGWDDVSTAKAYGTTIGSSLINSSGYKTFFVALPGVALSNNKTNSQLQLANIAQSSGASIAPGGNLFYSISTDGDINNVFDNIKIEIPEAIEYPNELSFQSVTFSQVFPKGVKVLSAQYGGNNLTISKTGEQYTVSGNLSGVKLVKSSTTGKYMLTSTSNIVCKFRYISTTGNGTWEKGVLNSVMTFNGGTLNYTDYFSNTGSVQSPGWTVQLRFMADIN